MAFDDKLRFSGTATATTSITTVAGSAATVLGIGVEVGAERLFMARLYVPGTCTTGDQIAVKFQDATTATGTYTDMGYAFPTWTMAPTGNTSAAMGLQIHTTGTVIQTDDPYFLAVRTRALKPWVRMFGTPSASASPLTIVVVGTPVDDPAF